MDSTISAALQESAENTRFLSSLSQTFPFNLSGDFFGAFFAAVGAIIVALSLDRIRKKIERNNLKPDNVVKYLQKNYYCYRLKLTNDSEYIARKVEINIEKIVDNDGKHREIIPTPLSWTHREEESRDIYPHQDAYLNICEVHQEQGKFIRITAPRISHLEEMVILKKGTTKLLLRCYQENGQSREIKLKVEWNGRETFNEEDLPTIGPY